MLRDAESGEMRFREARRFSEILAWPESPAVVCVDIPIGLLDEARPGGRNCDREARALLGSPRASSVFPPPVRAALSAKTYEDASRCNRESSAHGLAISRQCWGIAMKIREVDEMMTAALQERVIEVHPEVSFYALNGDRGMTSAKRTKEGLAARIELIEAAWGTTLGAVVEDARGPTVGRDDVVDAMIACWTAERVARGSACTLPVAEVNRDARGLRMEIVR
jgi:predicted RNase H-like nuclease